jgi:hypothetical protein
MASTRSYLAGGVLLLGASVLPASGIAHARVPGGTPGAQGGVGVPGEVPGGTLGGQVPGGTLGGQVPGGTLGGDVPGGTLALPPGEEMSPFIPGLVVPEPAPLPGFEPGWIDDPHVDHWPAVRAWRGGRAGMVHR